MRFQLSFTVILAAAASFVSASPTSNLTQRHVAFDWAHTKVRGVNIGGWLVLESFIAPSLFNKYSTPELTIGDEWTLCTKLGKKGCYNALKPHWDNFVKLDDFKKIKKAGINVVRIPIGYWAYLDIGDPYTSGAAPYLDKAVGWARDTGLKVIIDLHAAPKSQNGFDHSGHKSAWPGWGQGDSIPQTHKVLKILEDKYAIPKMQDVVIAIELLNEPYLNALDSNMVEQFYRDGYYNLRLISDTPMMMHDGFWNPAWLNNFLTPRDNNAQQVVVDHHEYQIFDASLVGLSTADHRTLTCKSVEGYDRSDKWLVVGEWSAAMTDCAPHLNGFRAGNRYEGSWQYTPRIGSCKGKSGKVKDWSKAWKDDVRRYIETQLDAFEAKSNGWVFWNFKIDGGGAGEWDLFQLLDGGVFPQPLNNRKFGKYCKNF